MSQSLWVTLNYEQTTFPCSYFCITIIEWGKEFPVRRWLNKPSKIFRFVVLTRKVGLICIPEQTWFLMVINFLIRQSGNKDRTQIPPRYLKVETRNVKPSPIFLLPPGWNASPSQGYPSITFAGTYLYTWVKEALCPRPGSEPGPLAPESTTLNMRPPRPHLKDKWRCSLLINQIDNFFAVNWWSSPECSLELSFYFPVGQFISFQNISS